MIYWIISLCNICKKSLYWNDNNNYQWRNLNLLTLLISHCFVIALHFSKTFFSKIPDGPILFKHYLLYIYLWYLFWDVWLSFSTRCIPQYIPLACPRAFCPRAHGMWILPGAGVFTACERSTREREQQKGSSSVSLFAWCDYNGNMHKWEKA